MTYTEILTRLVIVVPLLLLLGTALTVGFGNLKDGVYNFPSRMRRISPYIGFVIATLLFNKVARDFGPEISRVLDWNITGLIYNLEGSFVSHIQFEHSVLIAYFSFTYIYLYVFILIFPFSVYLTLEDQKPLRILSVSFVVNYLIGITLYILFISYGPRNILEAQEFMYNFYPETQTLTSKVNSNTNVFPSLHSSLSMTVVVLSWKTRNRYPRMIYLTVPVAFSVIIATMYLGIHWLTDVVAGIFLALISVRVAILWEERRGKYAGYVPERIKSIWDPDIKQNKNTD